MINGSTKQTPNVVKEIKTYSPPKQKKQNIEKKVEHFEEKKDTKPLKLEEEETLILEELVETEISENKKISKKTDPIVSPAARKMVKESNLNLKTIKGSGKHGVILKEDVMSLMGVKPQPSERKIKHGPEERIRMTRLRLTIAKRLKRLKRMQQC